MRRSTVLILPLQLGFPDSPLHPKVDGSNLAMSLICYFLLLNEKNSDFLNALRVFNYRILSSIVHTFFYIENDAEIFPVHYTWKVAEKGFKITFMMNKLAKIISFEIILEK